MMPLCASVLEQATIHRHIRHLSSWLREILFLRSVPDPPARIAQNRYSSPIKHNLRWLRSCTTPRQELIELGDAPSCQRETGVMKWPEWSSCWRESDQTLTRLPGFRVVYLDPL